MDMILSKIQWLLSTGGPFVILLGFLVFVHELGHFLVARWCGVRVETFSLGFGKKIIQIKRGDTTYCVSIVPFGGYVKMFGFEEEVEGQMTEAEKKFSFSRKKLWQRFLIVLAGPLMNFVFAIVIFAMVSLMGEEIRQPVLGDVREETLAYTAGFRSGDEILSVNGVQTKTWDQFQEALNTSANVKTFFQVRRKGDGAESISQPIQLEAVPVLKPNENILSLREYIAGVDGFSQNSRAPFIGVIPHSSAENFGLLSGDRLLKINKRGLSYFRQIENFLIAEKGQNIELEIERGMDKPPKTLKLSGQLGSISSLTAFGIELPDLYLAKIVDGSPAEKAGLLPGDRILRINSKKVVVWDDVLNAIKGFSGEGTVQLVVSRNGEEKSFDLVPKLTSHTTLQGMEDKRFTIGIIQWMTIAPPVTELVQARNPVEAFLRGWKRTYEVTLMTGLSFVRLFQGAISPKNIGGVISIAQVSSETFKMGITHFLQLMAIISVNLFAINLFPVPVLDGGHLLFYVIEGLRGAPLSMKNMEIAQQVGLVVLVGLMALSLFNDFSRLLGF